MTKKIFTAILLASIGNVCQSQITSTYDTDTDGWTFFNSLTGAQIATNHNAAGGNPGGFASVSFSSNQSATVQSWIAPSKFLGNQLARSFGMHLSFDLQQSQAGTSSITSGDVRIENGGTVLVYSLPVKPAVAPAWSSYALLLDETFGWRISSTTGALATRAQIKQVLTNITAIEIRGTFATNATYVSGIDNVVLEQKTLGPIPAITSVAPERGTPLETTITISGSGFGSTVSGNAVIFGSVAAEIVAASPTEISVIVPQGAKTDYITVVNTGNGLSATSPNQFSPTFDGGGRIIRASMKPTVYLTLAGTGDVHPNLGDIDGDGWVDIVFSKTGDNTVSVMRNLATGGSLSAASFAAEVSFDGDGEVTLMDFDGDGKLDIATPFAGFVVHRNTSTPGTVSFAASAATLGGIGNIGGTHAADIDGDGRPEYLVAGSTGSVAADFFIAQNVSSPGQLEFGPLVSYFGGATLDAGGPIATGDLDGDGKPEIIVINGFDAQLNVMKNNSTPGTISLAAPFVINDAGPVRKVVIVDVDGDGKKDLCWTGDPDTGDLLIRRNIYSGGAFDATAFDNPVSITSPMGYISGGLALGDINGDGKADLIQGGNNDVAVYENGSTQGSITSTSFATGVPFRGGTDDYVLGPHIADLNGDNKPEAIFGTANHGPRIFLYENVNIKAPEISLNTVSPLQAPPGATVTITGSHFSSTPSENIVRFGAAAATVLTATPTELTVEVPLGATYAPVSVTRDFLTARYHLPFSPTFTTNAPLDATSFSAGVDFPLSGVDYELEISDLDNDGKPDLVVEATTARIFQNTHTSGAISAGSLTAAGATNSTSTNPRVIDIDEDGKPDIISGNGIARNVSTTTIAFEDNESSQAGSAITAVFADFDRDGKTDLVAGGSGTAVFLYANWTRGGIPLTQSTGATYLDPISDAMNYAKTGSGGSAAAADFDNDGFPEFAATSASTDQVRVWRSNGGLNIGFSVVGDIAVGDNPGRLYPADFDLDGKMDLAMYHNAGTESGVVTVLHNQSSSGNIVFVRQDFVIGSNGTTLAIGDLTGDGKPEIIVPGEATNRVSIFRNTSAPGAIDASSFASPIHYTVAGARAAAVGDLNLDGKPDLIVTRVGFITVLENAMAVPAINFTTQPSPVTACEGNGASFSVTVTGDANLVYQWQIDNAGFVNLANDATYSGVNTATLTVSNVASTLNGATFRVLVHGDATADTPSAAVQLSVDPLPPTPGVTGDTGCSPASLSLHASGGADGEYRWYTEASGGSAIAGEVNSVFTTPSLTATTSYFVSLHNGSCESARVQVVATINSVSTPVVANESTCSGSAVTFTASGGIDGNYRWYDVPTGGSAIAGETSPTFTTPPLSADATYYVSIDNGLCESERVPANATVLTVPPEPVVTSTVTAVDGVVTLCNNSTVLGAPAGFSEYQWSSGEQTQEITVMGAGIFTVTVGNGTGCFSVPSEAVEIVVDPLSCNAPPSFVATTVTTEIGGYVTIDLAGLIFDPDENLDLTTLQVVSQPSSGATATIEADFSLSIDYSGIQFTGMDHLTIQVCDVPGECTLAQISIEVIGDIEVYNAISPNGDNRNDIFFLRYIDVLNNTRENRVTIVNRWGDVVFETENYDNVTRVFRGLNMNGNELPSGTYFYRLDFLGKIPAKTGYLTLKR